MRIDLIGWETESLRCPDMTINLLIGSNPAHVSLIQMPNGTAKTTTLNLVRAALNGEASRWTSEKVKSFRRVGELNNRGKFHLKLRVDEEPLDFELNFDFEEGKVNYFTSSPSLGGGVNKWEPPLHLRRFCDKRFVRLFIFDGEFAKDFLDSDKTHASQAVDNLFQLYLLDEIKEKIDKHWNEATENKVKSQQGKTRQKKTIDQLKERIKKVELIHKKKKDELESLEREIDKLEKQIDEYNSQHEDLSKQLNESKQEKVKAEEKIESRIQEIMQRIRKPQSLHEIFVDSLLELKDKLDKAKLPEKASRQFFVDLLEEEQCICGRELNNETRQAIQNRAELYLSDRTAAFLNGLKEDIRNNFSSETYEVVHSLTENIQQLKTDIEVRQYAETRCTAIQNQIFEEGDSRVKSWTTSLDDKKGKKYTLEEHLKSIERSPMPKDDPKNIHNTWCLKVLKKWLEEAEQRLAEISDTVALTQKKQLLQKIVDNSLKKARENLQDLMIGECNVFLKIILERDPIIITKIDRCLHLKNQKAGSEGQMLSVGYTFLNTLLARIHHNFPLFVDSPANAIDANIRRNIAQQIPQFCHQFIALTISTEREGFTNTLERESTSTKFITVFRKTEGTKHLQQHLPLSGVSQTKNAIIVESKEYFYQFDLEDEQN